MSGDEGRLYWKTGKAGKFGLMAAEKKMCHPQPGVSLSRPLDPSVEQSHEAVTRKRSLERCPLAQPVSGLDRSASALLEESLRAATTNTEWS